MGPPARSRSGVWTRLSIVWMIVAIADHPSIYKAAPLSPVINLEESLITKATLLRFPVIGA